MKLDFISVEKLFPSGMWEVSTILHGHLVRYRYDGSRKNAVKQFKTMLGVR